MPLECADKEVGSERLFKLHQALAHRAQGNVLPRRRARQRPLIAHGDEELERGQIDPPDEIVDLSHQSFQFLRTASDPPSAWPARMPLPQVSLISGAPVKVERNHKSL
jgi:hypothetical protein